jgi:hypothetical protein
MSADQLRRAYELIRQGQKKEAIAILQPILQADRANADAWWLLANALSDPQKQEQALKQLLKLRPNDDRAEKMLGRIQAEQRAKEEAFSFPVSAEDPFANVSSSMPSWTPSEPTPEDPFADIPTDAVEGSSSDPFAARSDDPFIRHAGEKPKRQTATAHPLKTQQKSGDNPVVMILAIIGVLTLGCCIVSAVLISRGIVQFGEIMASAVPEMMAGDEFFQDYESVNHSFDRSSARDRGSIEVGQARSGMVDTFDDDYYTLTLSGQTQVTINVISRDELDPVLYVYDSDSRLIDSDDDIDLSSGNLNSRLRINLGAGTYYIVVSAFGSGGEYDISLSS